MNLLLKFGIPILAVLSIAAFFVLGTRVGVEEFRLNGISAISPQSFVVNGVLSVKNTGKLGIPIQSLTYDVILKRTGDVIGSGSVPAVTLQAKSVTPVKLDQQIKWIPTALVAADLATQKSVPAIVRGTVVIPLPGGKTYSHDFSAEVDIKDYVLQFAPVPVQEKMQEVDGVTEPVQENLPAQEPLPSLI